MGEHVVLALVTSLVGSYAFAQPADLSAPVAAITASTSAPEPTPSVESLGLKWSGDIRHRFDSLQNESPATGKNENYDQWRLRARLGAKANPTDTLSIEARLATGTGGTSTNQSYGDTVKGSRNYDIGLDRASFKYTPAGFFALTAGRMATTMLMVGENDLLFDSDLNFDGAAISLQQTFDLVSVGVQGGQFTLDEAKDSATAQDVRLNAAQAFARYALSKDELVELSVSQYAYTGVPQHAAIVGTDFLGNSNSGSVYTYGYRVTSVGLAGQFSIGAVPVVVYTEAAQNEEVSNDKNAIVYGVKINKLKASRDWTIYVDYRQLDKDSTLAILTDGESFGGGTDGRSWRVGAGYNINKSFAFNGTYLTGERGIGSGGTAVKRNRLMFDLSAKF